MPFMLPYWTTTALVAIFAIFYPIVVLEMNSYGSRSGKSWRNKTIVMKVAAVVAVVLIFVGVWVPFFVPGLYG